MVITRSGAGHDVDGVQRPERASPPVPARAPVRFPQSRGSASGEAELARAGSEQHVLRPPSATSDEEAEILSRMADNFDRFKRGLPLNLGPTMEVQTHSSPMLAGVRSIPAAQGHARESAHPPPGWHAPGEAGLGLGQPDFHTEARNEDTWMPTMPQTLAPEWWAPRQAHPPYADAREPATRPPSPPGPAPQAANSRTPGYVQSAPCLDKLAMSFEYYSSVSGPPPVPPRIRTVAPRAMETNNITKFLGIPLPPMRHVGTWHGDDVELYRQASALQRREIEPYNKPSVPQPARAPPRVPPPVPPQVPRRAPRAVPQPAPPPRDWYEVSPPLYSVPSRPPVYEYLHWREERGTQYQGKHFSAPPVPPRRRSGPVTPPLNHPAERSTSTTAITELAQAIVRATQAGHAHRYVTDLPTYSGAASEWLSFRAAYNETAPHLSNVENMTRLKRALKGPAREAVIALFLGASQPGDIMRRLETRFGRPDALVLAELDKVRALPRMTDDPRDICVFACKISNIVAAVRALNREHHLYSPEIARVIEEKMTPIIRSRWFDYELSATDSEPALSKLGLFFEREAERNGRHARAEVVEERREPRDSRPRPPSGRGRVNTAAAPPSSAPRAGAAKSAGPTAAPTKCRVCEGAHVVPDCAKFKGSTVDERWNLARECKLCFRCLKYRAWKHRCGQKCSQCTLTHHPMLHQSAEKNTVSSTWSARPAASFLKIVPVIISGPKGEWETYALLDDGSTVTLVEEETACAVGADGPLRPFVMEVVTGTNVRADRSRQVQLKIKGKYMGLPIDVSARTIGQLNLTAQTVSTDVLDGCEHLFDIKDEVKYEHAVPTILIGQDNWRLLLSKKTKTGTDNQPVASLTELGWVLHGRREMAGTGQQACHSVQRVYVGNIEEQIQEHFALESLGVQPRRPKSDPEQRAVQLLQSTITELPEGGYEVGLPWRYDNTHLPDNYQAALGRLKGVERRLGRDDTLRARYTEQIDRMVAEGYAEKAPMPAPSGSTWYLPHFGVDNPAKKKLRIVHDAAAKTKGTSLNDLLLTGPDLLESLPGVLMRFRQHAVAVTADIKDMFLRIKVRSADRDALRFLWREQSDAATPTEYRMTSVIFGATSSPFTAIFVKNYNAERHGTDHPAAVRSIVRCHYMDDYLESFRTVEEAKGVAGAVNEIHKKGKFVLQRWTSNDPEAIVDMVSGTNAPTDTRTHSLLNQSERILGIIWQPASDYLSYNLNFTKVERSVLDGSRIPTKRQLLSAAMSLYDPLGLVAPITIQPKHTLQRTWHTGVQWDEPLPQPLYNEWLRWLDYLRQIENLTIPRVYKGYSCAERLELHTFVDASENAYAAAVYWRAVSADGEVGVSLAAAKARVAGKVSSVPRLELQAAVLGARLAHAVRNEHDREPTASYYWTDSATVIAWLRAGARAFKPFVAHRVAEVEEITNLEEWRWVPSADNVADDATRDPPPNFNATHRWFVGPDFLYNDAHCWTHSPPIRCETTGEEKCNASTRNSCTSVVEATPDPSRFSHWLRLLRATARVLQFIQLCRRTHNQHKVAAVKRTRAGAQHDPTWTPRPRPRTRATLHRPPAREDEKRLPLSASTLLEAQSLLWKRSQALSFASELGSITGGRTVDKDSRLRDLPILYDEDGLLKVRTRLRAAAALTPAQTTPTVLDGNEYTVRLYLSYIHKQLHHGGTEIVVNEARQRYHIVRLRPMVKKVIAECQQCRLRRAKPTEPPTGELPLARLAHNQRPFTYVGLDYFGPITITVGRSHQKRYVALFTCLTTRALHLEIAGSLTTDSAINAIRRMIGRRGCPTEMWSDNGSNFRGADAELRRAAVHAAVEEASIRTIKWRFIPPGAPFMGGAWERMVRSVKTALRATLNERYPTEETLHTLLVEAEHTINSRPLTHVPVETDDEPALTPMHFILGGPSKVPLPGAFVEGDLLRRAHWRAAQQLANMFWRRWIREVLPLLRLPRDPHGRGHPVRERDVVIVADGNLPRNSWPKGIVTRVYPGADGIVRTVDVRCSSGIMRRPAKKLIVLPVDPTCTTED